MALAVDLSSGFLDVSSDLGEASGSFDFGTAASQDAIDLSGSMDLFAGDQSPILGSWPGSAMNHGAMVVFTSDVTAIQSGSWFGSDQTWGVNGASYENHDKFNTTSDEFPNVGEGINTGEYNPFPLPPVEPEEPRKIRDATRFQKAYSFSRNHPVRIRVFRR
jgi:hypothetical protein